MPLATSEAARPPAPSEAARPRLRTGPDAAHQPVRFPTPLAHNPSIPNTAHQPQLGRTTATSEMAPGKKQKDRKPTSPPREAPLTDIEIQRMQNIVEHNRMFQRLGLGQLRAMVNAKPIGAAELTGAAKPARADSEDSGSLYQPGDEDMQQEAVDKEALLDLEPEFSNSLPINVSGGSRTSKRVTAVPEAQSQPGRITRKRARELSEPSELCNVPATDPQDNASDQELIVANAHTQSDNHNMTRQDACMDKRRMGRGLDRISRGFNNKIKVHNAAGNKRPEALMQAAKLASEAGIFIRDHIPIFPHWKDYKKDDAKELLDDYMGKIGMQFDIDIESKPVKDACSDILKKGQWNMRYMLKKKYFNGVPANQEKCLKLKDNREQVKLQQKTGSRSYIAHCYAMKQAKYKDAPPTAIDLFKETHCSSKTGFSEAAKNTIAETEEKAAAPPQEGQNTVTPTQVVLQVMPKSTFLRNIGMQPAKRGTKASEVDARVQELENELVAAAVRAQVRAQLEEKRAARKKVEEEHEMLKKQIGEMHGFYRSFLGTQSAPSGSQQ